MKDLGTIHTTGDFNRGRVLPPKVGGDDRQNAFQRVNVARDAALEEEKAVEIKPESEAKRIARKEANKRRWSGDKREQTTPLTRPTAVPRDAAPVATRSQVHLDMRTVRAVVLQWQKDNANVYYDSPWKGAQFEACLVDHAMQGELLSYDVMTVIFNELKAGNHLEPKPGPRSRGDFATRSGPTPYQGRSSRLTRRK